MNTILIIVLVVLLLGSVGGRGYIGPAWGNGLSGGLGLVLVVLVILMLTGRV